MPIRICSNRGHAADRPASQPAADEVLAPPGEAKRSTPFRVRISCRINLNQPARPSRPVFSLMDVRSICVPPSSDPLVCWLPAGDLCWVTATDSRSMADEQTPRGPDTTIRLGNRPPVDRYDNCKGRHISCLQEVVPCSVPLDTWRSTGIHAIWIHPATPTSGRIFKPCRWQRPVRHRTRRLCQIECQPSRAGPRSRISVLAWLGLLLHSSDCRGDVPLGKWVRRSSAPQCIREILATSRSHLLSEARLNP
jgi:hypothetical protein